MSSLLLSVFMRDDPKLLQDSFHTLTNENLFLLGNPSEYQYQVTLILINLVPNFST